MFDSLIIFSIVSFLLSQLDFYTLFAKARKQKCRSTMFSLNNCPKTVEENRFTLAMWTNSPCWVDAWCAYVHSSHVALIRFPDLLHHLLLCSWACLDGALHCDGPLWVVQSQVLKTGKNSGVKKKKKKDMRTTVTENKSRHQSKYYIIKYVALSGSLWNHSRDDKWLSMTTKNKQKKSSVN